MKKERPIIWKPTEKQAEFLACPAREVLFSGTVGSGKTDSILMAAVSQTGNAKHRALILRRTFPMLRDMIGRSHELFLPLGATYNKATSQWAFPSGAIVEFGFLDAAEDMFRYMGRQFSCICWDELTSWPGDGTDAQGQPVSSAYIYMLSRLRAVEGSGLRLEIRATCTAGGCGHSWVKARWNIPNDGSSSEVIDPATGFRRVFIRATIADNPFLAGTEYERQLGALPEATRKTLLLGRWDVFQGAVFDDFDPEIHVCDDFEIPDFWPMFRAADDGFAAPAAVLWIGTDPTFDRQYVCAELYERGMTAETMARAVLEIDATFDRHLDGIIDSSAFSNVGLGHSRAQQMNLLGCEWRPAEKGQGSRASGWSAIHSRLALKPDGNPGLIIFRSCRHLIRTLPSLVYSATNPEDISNNCEDHLADSLRYALLTKEVCCRQVKLRV